MKFELSAGGSWIWSTPGDRQVIEYLFDNDIAFNYKPEEGIEFAANMHTAMDICISFGVTLVCEGED